MPAYRLAILARARDLYQNLAEHEPQNAMHMQNYQQVVGMMGGSSGGKLLTVEEGIVLVEELEATAPPLDQLIRLRSQLRCGPRLRTPNFSFLTTCRTRHSAR